MKSKEEDVLDYFTKNYDELFWRAYRFAEKIHKNHKRKDGSPYIVHPLEVCYNLLNYGVTDSIIHADAIIHDTKEEARDQEGIVISRGQIAKKVHPEVADDVIILTKEKGLDFQGMIEYMRRIEQKVRLALIKMADRLSNLRRGMFGIFSNIKVGSYTYETEYHILPMSERIITLAESEFEFPGKEEYVKYVRAFRGLRSSIKGILRGAHHSFQLAMELEKCREFEEKNRKLEGEIQLLKNLKSRIKD